MKRPILGITMGDPAGIGAEISIKALNNKELYEIARPFIIGDQDVILDSMDILSSQLEINLINNVEEIRGEQGVIDLLDLDNIGPEEYKYGEISSSAGRAAVRYILKGIELALSGRIDGIVTGPIHKEAINLAGYRYAGHTEILADKTGTEDYAMMLTGEKMRVIHVSTHVSLRQACDLVKKERVYRVIKLADEAVRKLGITRPRIAVAGLNPHAGEKGLFGDEELQEIIPAIKRASEEGIDVEGPLPPDTIFSKLRGKLYDIAVVMYHDQGHIPMKVTGFNYNHKTGKWDNISGVNVTVGLPIVRTSVDHGVAFDQAGKGTANEESMVEAIKLAAVFAEKN